MRWLQDRPRFIAALVALLFVAFVGTRTVYQSHLELMTANAYDQDGDTMRALEHYRRAMRWSFPLNPYPARAASSLQRTARSLEDEGRIDDALLAWRSIAGSSAATRFLYSARGFEQEEAYDEIARLVATYQSAGIDAGTDSDELAAQHRALLERDASPDPFWGTLLLIGFVAWVGGLVVTASRGFDATGRLQWATARAPLSGALVGFVAFVLGMFFA